MARYFFHHYVDCPILDHQGQQLPDLDAALSFAFAQTRSLAAYVVILTGRSKLTQRIEIADKDGEVLVTVGLGGALRMKQNSAY